ncbi:MAG: alpha/beta fold hydrolase [Gemmatimonadota bacterium]|jgi:pimeloyl-ACP methyl ester carboxylesterase
MNPFYFGPSRRPLFGLYTRARGRYEAGPAALLCYPVGSEYMRAHRAFRQLNGLLNREGLHVLRFDYSSTGDSSGSGREASLRNWLDDIGWAIEELKDTAMVEQVSVVGLRWGGTLAALACADRSDVGRLVLWDPIVSGRAYLDDRVGTPRPRGEIGIEGYPFSQALRDEMDAVDLRHLDGELPTDTTLLVARDREEYRRWVDPSRAGGRSVAYRVVPSSGDWAQADPFGDALIPQRIIQAIVQELTRVDVR